MRASVVTIFPEIVEAYMAGGILGRAAARGLISVETVNPRDFTHDRHRTVDDTPYGGGPGMVMKPEPLAAALDSILEKEEVGRKEEGAEGGALVIMTAPDGEVMTQERARELSEETRRLVFLCGRYEGVDERIREHYVERTYSIGDYVLTGGELPALVIIDASARLVPGVVGEESSLVEESFSWGILDYPHYTRPETWRGRSVPPTLLSGHHAEIARWRRREALRSTLRRRPDLMAAALEEGLLTDTDTRLIEEIKKEEGRENGDD